MIFKYEIAVKKFKSLYLRCETGLPMERCLFIFLDYSKTANLAIVKLDMK